MSSKKTAPSNREGCIPKLETFGRRSLLFVPGTRVDRVRKALDSGADAVIIDLEDAVRPEQKAEARSGVVDFLRRRDGAETGEKEVFVRMNSIRSKEGMKDLIALIEDAPGGWDGIVVPKTNSVGDVEQVADILEESGIGGSIGALIETIEGLDNINMIAAASPRMDFLMFGGADFASDLGVPMKRFPLEQARYAVVRAAARYGLSSVEMPWIDLEDLDGYEEDLEYCFALGFDARACIHPNQIALLHQKLAPTSEEVREARLIVDAFESAGGEYLR